MLPSDRRLLLVEDAKALIPLKPYLLELGLQLVPASEIENLASSQEVLGYFACFYACIDHPVTAWRRRAKLAKAGIPVVTWNRDAPHYLNRPKWRLRLACALRMIDIYATHTLIDEYRYRFAPTTVYLANALEPTLYYPPSPFPVTLAGLRDESNYKIDVSFFGGMDGIRYKEDEDRAHFFAALSQRLRKLGISHLFRETGDMAPNEQVAFILASKINLSFGARCEYMSPVASGLPERAFGIPGCGGFLLCDKRTHAKDDFVVGENWAEFDGLEDCVEKIQYWLRHMDAARDIAERSYHHVVTHHTYRKRSEVLHAALLGWHADRLLSD